MEKEDDIPFIVTSTECRGCVNLAEERKLIPPTAAGIHLHLVRPDKVTTRHDRDQLLKVARENRRKSLDEDEY